MAKITAHGDREVARFQRDDGYMLVLTQRGRLLRKLTRDSGYNVLSTGCTLSEVERYAAHRGAKSVPVRG